MTKRSLAGGLGAVALTVAGGGELGLGAFGGLELTQERFRLSPDGSTLWLTQLYSDPAVFDGLAARYMAWTRRPGEHVIPYDCDPTFGE